MIGGSDLILETHLKPHEAAKLVRKLIADDWPDAVFEDIDDEEPDVFICRICGIRSTDLKRFGRSLVRFMTKFFFGK
jgi:hypothetical protein